MNTRSTASRCLERALYVVMFIGLILCLVGCDGQSIYSEGSGSTSAVAGSSTQSSSAEPGTERIHANHDQGVDADLSAEDLRDPKTRDQYREIFKKWGVKQTPDWLAVCNQVNVPALRKYGIDPQKDLGNRPGGRETYICMWDSASAKKSFYIGRFDDIEKLKADKKFNYQKTVQQNGETYYLGNVEYFQPVGASDGFTCSAGFERGGEAYVASYIENDYTGKNNTCDALFEILKPQQ